MATNANGGIMRSGASGSYSYAVRSDRGNHPVNFVSFWDAARFTNWLTNRLTSGDTETGVYNLGGVTTPALSVITRDATAWANGGVAITSENEWYKAAYYSGSPTGAGGDGYWLLPTQSNGITTADANYSGSGPVAVGSYANRPSYYGTFDQGGNLIEWTQRVNGNTLIARGGSFANNAGALHGANRSANSDNFFTSTSEFDRLGFRVSSLSRVNLPEPSSYAAICGLLGLGLALTRRQTITDRKAQV